MPRTHHITKQGQLFRNNFTRKSHPPIGLVSHIYRDTLARCNLGQNLEKQQNLLEFEKD